MDNFIKYIDDNKILDSDFIYKNLEIFSCNEFGCIMLFNDIIKNLPIEKVFLFFNSLTDTKKNYKYNKMTFEIFLTYYNTNYQIVPIEKVNQVLEHLVNIKFITQQLLLGYIHYYHCDNIWQNIKGFILNYHYIYKGTAIILDTFINIPLFDYLLNDAIEKKLYDPEFNRYTHYTNNHNITENLDYNISINMRKYEEFRTYILSRLPKKYKYLKNLIRVQNIIEKNNISALQHYFEKYDKLLTPNTRILNNKPLLDYVQSIEMFYYLYHRGANINNVTLQYIVHKKLFYTSTVFNNIHFAYDYLDVYERLGLDFRITKKCCRIILSNIFKGNTIEADQHEFYLFMASIHNKIISRSTRYIKKQNNKYTTKLYPIFYKDLINKILLYM